MQFLKQSTVVTVQMGPFLSATDGVTALPALSPAVSVSKAGAAFAARSSATAIAYDAFGFYRVELNATDTATLGRTLIASAPATAIPVWHEFTVVPAAVFDAMVGGTAALPVNLTQIDGLTTAGNLATLNLKELRLINPAGNGLTCQGGAAATAGAHFSSTNTVGTGVKMTGSGVGYGLHLEQTGNNPALYVRAVGDVAAWIESTSNEGMTITGATNSPALRLLAQGSGSALKCEGGATGIGAEFIGGSTSGDAIRGTVTSGKALGDDIVDSILNRTGIPEPTAPPAWPMSLKTQAAWVGALARNKMTQTDTTQTIRNDADSAAIGTSAHSDDGTTHTRGEFA